MPYLVYSRERDAQARSRAEAEARGCDMEGTTAWWPVIEGPEGQGLIVTDAADPPRSGGKDPVAAPPDWLSEQP